MPPRTISAAKAREGRAALQEAKRRLGVLEAIDAIDATDSAERPVVVGHSAACTLAWLAADARPDAIARVGLIGGFPSTAGEQYAAFFPLEGGVMAFPGWEPFAGPDTADMSDDLKSRVAGSAHPVPGGVAEAVVALTLADARRLGFDPATLKFDRPVTTAAGQTMGADITLDYVSVSGARVEKVQALVLQEGLETSLLGMTYLGRLSRFEASRDALILRR